MKRSMGMDGPKAVFASAKSGEIQRRKAGKIKTRKLPTSLDELVKALPSDQQARINERAAKIKSEMDP